jgi:GT2 family glycosyltransferase
MAVGGKIPLLPDADCQQRRIIGPKTPDWFTLTNFGGIGAGCNMCFRRTAFELWPGFDERLGRGAPLDSAEEHFSFFQLVLLGYRCVHTPQAVVWHPAPQSAADWKQYNLNNLTNTVAYAALLWTQFPQTRRLLIQHLWNRSFGERGRARAASGIPQLSFGEKLRVVANGLRLFWRMPKATQHAALIAVPAPKAS